MSKRQYDAIIIGGGFYGCSVALFLRRYFKKVLIIEEAEDIITRASYWNQARIHNGYHYPRNFLTALRSHGNFERFSKEYAHCIVDHVEHIYAISRMNSKVQAAQFRRLCGYIGLPLSSAPPPIQTIFNKHLIEDVFVVEEAVFDAGMLRLIVKENLRKEGIDLQLAASVEQLTPPADSQIGVTLTTQEQVHARFIFNCSYARINTISKNSKLPRLPLKHEIVEVALVEVPTELKHRAVTVMDGPFFSLMPFPQKKLHSFTHVRYSPHAVWTDHENKHDPYRQLEEYDKKTKYPFMIRDAIRYMPILKNAVYRESFYEVKSLLLQNEFDDGRPILFRKDYGFQNLFLVMGSKIDTVYDVLNKIKDQMHQPPLS